ncbi:MAG: class I SAM-dependent methyltransferase [Chloroflexi bacterium]|nr:class I SAM-dependent methyltransferase [Chloroflexota bacterium]
MTRLANIEKAGYFPLPPTVTSLIASHITAPHGGRLLDTCGGEGAALVALAESLGLEPYGVELHEDRAKIAQERIADFGLRIGDRLRNPQSEIPAPRQLLEPEKSPQRLQPALPQPALPAG